MIDHPTRQRHLKSSARWTAADIRAEIVRRGSTSSKVIVAAGFSARAGRAALTSARYAGDEIALAAFPGVCPSTLWPERYAPGAVCRSAHRAGRAA